MTLVRVLWKWGHAGGGFCGGLRVSIEPADDTAEKGQLHIMSDEGRAPLLRVKNLVISLNRLGSVPLVREASFCVPEGSVTAIVGQSGSGKSLTALAILGLLNPDVFAVAGDLVFNGSELRWDSTMEGVRGNQIGMVFQDPGAHLNPLRTIGAHIDETLRHHSRTSANSFKDQAMALLRDMKFADPARIYKSYPHELSGGQKQRAMIAMAIAGRPRLLIADEPTSALDATIQRQVLALLSELKGRFGLTILVITHDLGLAAQFADRIVVMNAGEVVESGPSGAVLRAPQNPYTRQLVACRDRLPELAAMRSAGRAEPSSGAPRLIAKGVAKTYCRQTLFSPAEGVEALRPLSLSLHRGETVAVVGESGSGKSTLAKLLMRLIEPSGGAICINGLDVTKLPARQLRPVRRAIQMVFQDPYSALDAERTIGETLIEPMQINRIGSSAADRRARACSLLQKVGLEPSALDRLPSAFSGGERQRIAIARCLGVEPDIIICDECVSALDAHLQVQILELLATLQRELGLSYVFISHDLEIVRHISDRVIVLMGGVVVDEGPTASIFDSPSNPYTATLLGSAPRADIVM